MKVQIKQIDRYEITIDGETYTSFNKVDEWEGMIKFSGVHGTIIVDKNTDEFSNIFSELFGKKEERKSVEFLVVKISPKLSGKV